MKKRKPDEIRILGIATYIQTSSTRRTAKILSEFHPVSHTAVWKWIKKFEEKLPISTEKKRRNLVAIDETVVKQKEVLRFRCYRRGEERVNSDEDLHDKKLSYSEVLREGSAGLLRERAKIHRG
ncbi:MAG: hypothetical protein ABWW66_05585 [Archaeoglobaceae archaeon]